MSIESTPPSLPGLTGVTIHRAEGPRGILKIAVRTDASVLAERLSQLWLHDGLPELARALAAEREHYPTTGKTRCHEVAFEFAYGSFVNVRDPEHSALRDWKWCVGATASRDTHSWIEHLGEAFDSAMVLADGKPEQVLWVRQASELRAFYQAVAVEARTFKDFVDWMGAPRGKLFKRYPVVARIYVISAAEARVYFDRAVEIASRIGDENLSRWTALLYLASASAVRDDPRPRTAYRLSRGAELTYEYVARDKHFDWEGTVEALTDLCASSALAILARWRDRRFGDSGRLLPTVVYRLLEQGRLPALTPIALAGLEARWDRLADLERIVAAESDSARRSVAAHMGERKRRLPDGVSAGIDHS